ncbi:MAG: hypothetical protein GXZ13_07100 [Synergistaceae bacterium]|nr:hypothetical protein [Synergistaceae bacterium]
MKGVYFAIDLEHKIEYDGADGLLKVCITRFLRNINGYKMNKQVINKDHRQL